MFLPFFDALRRAGLPVSLPELLAFLEVLSRGLHDFQLERFYHLARMTLVKDERHLDRFDRVFAHCFRGLEAPADLMRELPAEWLQRLAEGLLDPERAAEAQARPSFEALMEELKKRLEEQRGRHAGGSKWIGTGGISPFGAYGSNPFGVRIGQDGGGRRSAAKVWDRRDFRDFADDVELGTRGMKVALRRLRRFAREGRDLELDLPGTIRSTARNGGWLDLQMARSRENTIEVLLLLDVGGSMDDHVARVEALFSAARSEFKRCHHMYFHNCLYERVWKHNGRRFTATMPTEALLRAHDEDVRVLFVGDASMAPSEIDAPGGSVEHGNEEPGATWMRRAIARWPRSVWINPLPESQWGWTHSIAMMRTLVEGRMVPLSLGGLERAMRMLS